jgi:hypothetical protein
MPGWLLPLCKAVRPLGLNLQIAHYRDGTDGKVPGRVANGPALPVHAPIESSHPVTGKQQRGLLQKP